MKKYFGIIVLLCHTAFAFGQTENSAGDVVDYREVDGKIIVTAMLNGKMANFALDLGGHNTILESELVKYGIKNEKKGYSYEEFVCRNYKPKSSVVVDCITLGNITSKLNANFFVLADEPYLKEIGVIGTLDASLFVPSVLTIDTERKKLTVTAPFRPPYMKLSHRAESEFTVGATITFNVMIGGVACNVVADTWSSAAVSLTPADYTRFSVGQKASKNGFVSACFGKDMKADKQFSSAVSFVKTTLNDVAVVENKMLKKSAVGMDFIRNGVISFDTGRGNVYFQPHGMVVIDDSQILPKDVVIEQGVLNPITAKYFKDNIYDYTKGGEFKSKSDKIYVVDFWATWCGPCMSLLPVMEKLAEKYKDRIIFCKVNADKETELCNAFSVKALPTLFFIPAHGAPIVNIGATPEKYIEIIEELLK